MPRKPPISWRESDTEKLERDVKRFNTKIYRTRSKHPEIADILPNTIKKKDKQQLIEDFKEMPRSEFNKYLNSLERFTERGAEKVVTNEEGVATTKWRKREIQIDTAAANREKAKERKELDIDLDALPKNMMNDIKANELKPKSFDFNKIKSPKELEMFGRTVKRQSRANRLYDKMDEYKKNYLYTVEYNLGSQGRKLYDFISKVPPDVLYEKYFEEDPVLKIQFASDPQPADVIVYESLSHWSRALGASDFNKYYEGDDLELLQYFEEDYDYE